MKYAILRQNGTWASIGGQRLTFSFYVDAFNARAAHYSDGRVVEISDERREEIAVAKRDAKTVGYY